MKNNNFQIEITKEECKPKCKYPGLHRQDARGVLPIDTATKCIYTYSINEWKHIIKLRSDSAAHPNAQIISNMIKKELESLGYEFN